MQQMKQAKLVVVTAPHVTCPSRNFRDPSQRQCDLRAEETARMLYSHLKERDIDAFLYLNTNLLRSVMDLNRKVARKHPWRQRLTRWMIDNQPLWLIDVHSFPSSYSWGKNINPFSIVLSDARPSHSVKRATHNMGIPILRGEKNDILDEMIQVPNKMLWEVNEDPLVLSRQELERMVQRLVNVIENA
jgi:hypothetical protein